jgi:hypothetical protein
LLAIEKVLVADRRVVVGTLQYGRVGDAQAAPQRQGIGGKPFRGDHDPHDLLLGADEGYVERIGGDARAGVGHTGNVLQRGVPAGVVLPELRRDQIRRDRVQHDDGSEHALVV